MNGNVKIIPKGTEFGNLIVGDIADNYYKSGVWYHCKCKCGNPEDLIRKGTELRRANRFHSCGFCERYEMINHKYGRLTVKECIGKIPNKHGVFFLCDCECGNKNVIKEMSKLKTGHTKSCGCLQKEVVSKTNKKYNTFDIQGDVVVGYTSNGESFFFDAEDLQKVKKYCWYITNTGYVAHDNILLHRYVLGASDGFDVDHKNHNTVDCRKSNLRECTHKENICNSKTPSHNTSGYKGVIKDKRNGKWMATIIENGRNHNKTGFDTPQEAFTYRLQMESLYQGEFSYVESTEKG